MAAQTMAMRRPVAPCPCEWLPPATARAPARAVTRALARADEHQHVPQCSKDLAGSVVVCPETRQSWKATLGECVSVCHEAVARRQHSARKPELELGSGWSWALG